MPLDSIVTQSPFSKDWALTRASHWTLKMCWAPKKCSITGKQLWGKRAYYGERWITGPGEPVVDKYWIERNEFILWNLRNRT